MPSAASAQLGVPRRTVCFEDLYPYARRIWSSQSASLDYPVEALYARFSKASARPRMCAREVSNIVRRFRVKLDYGSWSASGRYESPRD